MWIASSLGLSASVLLLLALGLDVGQVESFLAKLHLLLHLTLGIPIK